MSWVQRFFQAVLPRSWFAALEAESRAWVRPCECGRETSVWEMGGVRFQAAGRPVILGRCAACGRRFLGQLRHADSPSKPG